MSTLAIIPARGGSKGLKRKNLAMLAGRPLVVHAIEHAKQSLTIADVVVSTDDEEIASVARGAGAVVVRRPDTLATDETTTLPVLQHALDSLPGMPRPDRIVTLQPTSPLRTASQIDQAVVLLDDAWDSVISVCLCAHSPYKMVTILDGVLRPFVPGAPRGLPRQRLPLVYRENGAVYVTWTRIVEQGSIWGERPRPYVMDEVSSVDIDSEIDLLLADAVLRSRLSAASS